MTQWFHQNVAKEKIKEFSDLFQIFIQQDCSWRVFNFHHIVGIHDVLLQKKEPKTAGEQNFKQSCHFQDI